MALMYDLSPLDEIFQQQKFPNDSPMVMDSMAIPGDEVEVEMELLAASQFLDYSNMFEFSQEPCFDEYYDADAGAALLPLSPSDHYVQQQQVINSVATKQEFDSDPFFISSYPKRQRTMEDSFFYYDYPTTWLGDFVPLNHPSSLFQAPEAEVPPLLLDFPEPPVFSSGAKKEELQKGGEKSLSAQSVAARQRRRKITEKTQELGKLVPGGQKMNTAEMFQAAYKYIKFLKSQVAILEVMESIEEGDKKEGPTEDLEGLVGSPLVQEKLYSTEKCLVPKKVVEALETDQEIQSNPPVLKEVKQFIRTFG